MLADRAHVCAGTTAVRSSRGTSTSDNVHTLFTLFTLSTPCPHLVHTFQVMEGRIKDPFITRWLNLLCFLLSGLPADGTIAAEMAFMFNEWWAPIGRLGNIISCSVLCGYTGVFPRRHPRPPTGPVRRHSHTAQRLDCPVGSTKRGKGGKGGGGRSEDGLLTGQGQAQGGRWDGSRPTGANNQRPWGWRSDGVLF